MLVLSRKKEEKLILKVPGQENIEITVVRIDNQNRVRLGINAPQEVVILRAELENSLTEV